MEIVNGTRGTSGVFPVRIPCFYEWVLYFDIIQNSMVVGIFTNEANYMTFSFVIMLHGQKAPLFFSKFSFRIWTILRLVCFDFFSNPLCIRWKDLLSYLLKDGLLRSGIGSSQQPLKFHYSPVSQGKCLERKEKGSVYLYSNIRFLI